MGFDLGWLAATDEQVLAATVQSASPRAVTTWAEQQVQEESPRSRTRRRIGYTVNGLLMLLSADVAGLAIVVRMSDNDSTRISVPDAIVLVWCGLALAAWLGISAWLPGALRARRRHAARVAVARQLLTAEANGLGWDAGGEPGFRSAITAPRHPAHGRPRFAASDGLEFGNLRWQDARDWHYLSARLPAPLPHLMLDAVANDLLLSDLPDDVDRSQRLPLEGDFDRYFRLYAPADYRPDALYIFTPDVMAALVGLAGWYNIEIIGDVVVFFVSPAADFATPGPWIAVDTLLTQMLPRLADQARRYRDERVAGQDTPQVIAAIRAAAGTTATGASAPPAPRIAEEGRRLEADPVRSALRSAGRMSRRSGLRAWYIVAIALYGILAALLFGELLELTGQAS